MTKDISLTFWNATYITRRWVVSFLMLFWDITPAQKFRYTMVYIFGVLTFISVQEYNARYRPLIISEPNPDTVELKMDPDRVHMVVQIHQFQKRDSCFGAYLVREMIRPLTPKGVDGPFEQIFFIERDVPSMHQGQHDITLHLVLDTPLPPTSGWVFHYERWENCSWLDSIWPVQPVVSRYVPVSS